MYKKHQNQGKKMKTRTPVRLSHKVVKETEIERVDMMMSFVEDYNSVVDLINDQLEGFCGSREKKLAFKKTKLTDCVQWATFMRVLRIKIDVIRSDEDLHQFAKEIARRLNEIHAYAASLATGIGPVSLPAHRAK